MCISAKFMCVCWLSLYIALCVCVCVCVCVRARACGRSVAKYSPRVRDVVSAALPVKEFLESSSLDLLNVSLNVS